jgi:hypothetical protein
MTETAIAILYEHSEWFKSLLAELDRRRVPYKRLHSSFVADPPNGIGFDPFARLVDVILHRAELQEGEGVVHAVVERAKAGYT